MPENAPPQMLWLFTVAGSGAGLGTNVFEVVWCRRMSPGFFSVQHFVELEYHINSP